MNEDKRSSSRVLQFLAVGVVLIVSCFSVAPVVAQVLYGSVVGVVRDPQGAGVPGAIVEIVNKNTNLTRETVTSSDGSYSLVNVVPGPYDVKVSLTGFRAGLRSSVPVTVGQIARVDVMLEVGSISETVTVASDITTPADRQVRPAHRIEIAGNRQPSAQPVPQLSDAHQPCAWRDAGGVPERSDRHAGPVAAHLCERHQSEHQQHPPRRSEQRQYLAAASRWLRRTGRDHRYGQHQYEQLRRRPGDGGRRGSHAGDQVRHQQPQGICVLLPQSGRAERHGNSSIRRSSIRALRSRRHGRRPDQEEQAVLLRRRGRATTNATAVSTPTRCRRRACATATSARCCRSPRPSGCSTRRPATPMAPGGQSSRAE